MLNGDNMKHKKTVVITSFFYIFLFLTLCSFLTTWWIIDNFGNVKIDQILYTMFSSLDGTDMSVVLSYIIKALFIPLIICAIVGYGHYRFKDKIHMKGKAIAGFLTVMCLVGSIFYADHRFGFVSYIKNVNAQTDIYNTSKKQEIEEVEYAGDDSIIYQDVGDAVITGENTNNLIYIYLESYENAFMDQANGGLKEINCLPELTQLAQSNISFSHDTQMGGAIRFAGTDWTIASMVAQSTGLPLKTDVLNTMDQYDSFMPGATTIGDILYKRGYVQELLICSQKEFAGTDKLFTQHGQFQIVDFDDLNQAGRVYKNEKTDWGANDQCLFRNAKEELNKLAATGQKFNFTMATLDCHMPSGYTCSECPTTYDNRYENIYACQSKQVNEFVNWCRQQSWFVNTTIVIVGDHPTMATDYSQFIPDDYTRTTYNCIINSKVTTDHIKNRTFTAMDMFPTTLAAMGFEIKGNKLGLGTNLFSSLQTVTEKYGVDYIEQEVQKSSEYLDENIYQFNEQ